MGTYKVTFPIVLKVEADTQGIAVDVGIDLIEKSIKAGRFNWSAVKVTTEEVWKDVRPV